MATPRPRTAASIGNGGVDINDLNGDSGFEEVLTMVERTSDAVVAALPRALRGPG